MGIQPNKIEVQVHRIQMPADTVTPVGLYLRLRDRYPEAVLLEGADNAEGKNGSSFIGIAPQAEIVIENGMMRFNVPAAGINDEAPLQHIDVLEKLEAFRTLFAFSDNESAHNLSGLGLIGYMGYDAVQMFEPSAFHHQTVSGGIPLLRFRLYRYMLVFNYLKHTLELVELTLPGQKHDPESVKTLIEHKDIPQFKFSATGPEKANMSDEAYLEIVKKGIAHCRRGDVFQVVLSRSFTQAFTGDEFNVYRALRSINPSPYLFFADYGSYRLFGSSPEAQLIIQNGKAVIHPIAGTYRKTGDDTIDLPAEQALLHDPKENAEHVMLVDLARNDLSRHADQVQVEAFREVHRYSHVIHLVSKVSGLVRSNVSPFALMADTFPAGTLSGAPKVRAMQIIHDNEPSSRQWYGGAIGMICFNGDVNMAIMIRSFLSRHQNLHFQAGAGIVVNSTPESEKMEIQHKLGALRAAIQMAKEF
ncbi:MAG: anthranilate synthase component I family protein [Saprospiraceae bacterium]|nr:anthranilate synthase component I family protein [Saprospiraceae bacterium]